MKRIRNTSKQPPLIAPAAVAKALGGEIVDGRAEFLIARPIAGTRRPRDWRVARAEAVRL